MILYLIDFSLSIYTYGKKKCNRPFAECENGLFNLLEREEKTTTTKNKEFKSLNFVNFIFKI